MLLLLPQRYVFSSKSQPWRYCCYAFICCYCYHKGTYFQANHNPNWSELIRFLLLLLPQRYVFSSKSQRISFRCLKLWCCYCYHKGTYFQANHNLYESFNRTRYVVIATTKVRIFKQITTRIFLNANGQLLLLLPQRYVFSSKSQPLSVKYGSLVCCYCYHKGTYFQANHNVTSSV